MAVVGTGEDEDDDQTTMRRWSVLLQQRMADFAGPPSAPFSFPPFAYTLNTKQLAARKNSAIVRCQLVAAQT